MAKSYRPSRHNRVIGTASSPISRPSCRLRPRLRARSLMAPVAGLGSPYRSIRVRQSRSPSLRRTGPGSIRPATSLTSRRRRPACRARPLRATGSRSRTGWATPGSGRRIDPSSTTSPAGRTATSSASGGRPSGTASSGLGRPTSVMPGATTRSNRSRPCRRTRSTVGARLSSSLSLGFLRVAPREISHVARTDS